MMDSNKKTLLGQQKKINFEQNHILAGKNLVYMYFLPKIIL